MHHIKQTTAYSFSWMKLGVLTVYLPYALLAEPTAARVQDKSPAFAAASIRPIEPGTPIRAEVLGLACHGIDGMRQAVTAAKPGVDPVLTAPQGRCVANGITLQSVIAFAYGISERNVTGGPNWVRMSGPIGFDPGTFTLRQTSTYAIDAVAEAPSDATNEDLRRMLQKLLTDRFGLKFHQEKRQTQGFALVVAKGGPKIKEVKSGYEPPRAIYDDSLRRSIKGTSNLAELLDTLLPSGFGSVFDKTELRGIYEYELLAPLPPPPAPSAPGRPAQQVIGGDGPPSNSLSSLSALLEAQLGLRLQSDSVSVELLVIDQVERPSPN